MCKYKKLELSRVSTAAVWWGFFLVSGISFTFPSTETLFYYLKHIIQLTTHIFMYFFQLRSLIKSTCKTNLRTKRSAALTMNCHFYTVMLNDFIKFRLCLSNQFLKTSHSRESALPQRAAVQCTYCNKRSELFLVLLFYFNLLLVYNSFSLQFKCFISCVISYRWENQIISLLTSFYTPENCPFSLISYSNSHTDETHKIYRFFPSEIYVILLTYILYIINLNLFMTSN